MYSSSLSIENLGKGGKKRQISSDSSESDYKVCRVGGSPGVQVSASDSTVTPCAADPDLSISEVIRQTNGVLFNADSSVLESSQSVFESPTVVRTASDDSSKMADRGKSPSNPSNGDIMEMLKQLSTKMENIDVRLERLERLEAKVDKFDGELTKLWNFIEDKYRKLDDKLNKVEDRVDANEFSSGLAADKVDSLQKASDTVKEDLLYIQSQSMRNNLVFTGIDEDAKESGETTERKLRDFMIDKLQMARNVADELRFERVHRIGQKSTARPHRQIVAKFCYFKDREEVRKLRTKLAGTSCYINEQFPKEIADRRKKLKPKMVEARKQGKPTWFSYDKLYIDGKLVETTDADK